MFACNKSLVCGCVHARACMRACMSNAQNYFYFRMNKIGRCLCLWVSHIQSLSEGLNNELIIVNMFCTLC